MCLSKDALELNCEVLIRKSSTAQRHKCDITENEVSKSAVPGMLLGYIDLARKLAQRGNSSPVATLIVIVSSFVLARQLLLDGNVLLKTIELLDIRYLSQLSAR